VTRRCFLALPLDEVARADLVDFMRGLCLEKLRLTRLENLHVTLKFLGDVDDPQVPPLIDALNSAAGECRAFELNMTCISYLPDARRARVVAAEGDRPPALMSLFQWVEEACHGVGFQREGRAYLPHITLGRFRTPPRRLPTPQALAFTPTSFPVNRFVLMQSTLDHDGPTYTALADFPLRV
jgi:RNA 2',3'-cyclic 3'-phosphodiesterase